MPAVCMPSHQWLSKRNALRREGVQLSRMQFRLENKLQSELN
jgi:hypothetical protein